MAQTIASILNSKGSEVWGIQPSATVYEAIAMMAEKGVGAVLVVADGRLEGILSERDYARKVILMGRSSKDTLVAEIMTRSVITATPEDTVDECMRIMTEHRIRHLPILRGGMLAGIISQGDLVKAVIAEQAETIQHLHGYIAGSYH